MAFSAQDIETIKLAKAQGKTKEQALAMLGQSRQGVPLSTEKKPSLANRVTDFLGLGGATKTFGNLLARQGVGTDTAKEVTQEFVEKPTPGQIGGALAQTAAVAGGMALGGPASLAGKVALGAGLGYAYDVGSDLIEDADLVDTITPGVGTFVGAFAPAAVKGVQALGGATKTAFNKTAETAKNLPEVIQGTKQMATDLVNRIPRALDKGKQDIVVAAEKAERLKTATPAVRDAINTGLDEFVDIDTIAKADPVTKQSLRQMVTLAETKKVGFRPQLRPESVAGNAAVKQFDLVENQRKEIGKKIGEVSDQLSAKTEADIVPLQRNMRDVLRQNNILPDASGNLIFKTKRLTPAQKEVVQDLYKQATSDTKLTHRQIHEFDQLFSKLQREARFKNQVDDIYLTVKNSKGEQSEVNIFKVFRDIFSQQLDELAPDIKPLNSEYRRLRNLQDDLENSIFKSGNFETTGNVNGGEFAQTNLRRLFSDAQSAADYRQIYENLDSVSRSLGYEGPRADDLAGFALELRKIYPETVPKTSAEGLLGGLKKAILEGGKPEAIDQQKALKALLEATE